MDHLKTDTAAAGAKALDSKTVRDVPPSNGVGSDPRSVQYAGASDYFIGLASLEQQRILKKYEDKFKEVKGASESRQLILTRVKGLFEGIKKEDKRSIQNALNDLETAYRRFPNEFDVNLRTLLIHVYIKGIGIEENKSKALIYLRPLAGFLPTADEYPKISSDTTKATLTSDQIAYLEACVLDLEEDLLNNPESVYLLSAYQLTYDIQTKIDDKEVRDAIMSLEQACPEEHDDKKVGALFLLAKIYSEGIRIEQDQNKYQMYLNRCSVGFKVPELRKKAAQLGSVAARLSDLAAGAEAGAANGDAKQQPGDFEKNVKDLLADLDKETEARLNEIRRKIIPNDYLGSAEAKQNQEFLAVDVTTIFGEISEMVLCSADAKQSFRCPITKRLMKSPMLAADGHSYDEAAIEEWFIHNNISYVTGEVLANKDLIPNRKLKKAIDSAFIDKAKEKFQHYQRVANETQSSNAQLCIGICYFKGWGVQQDEKQASAWYHKAAVQGNVDALNLLALLYERGVGVAKDIELSVKLYKIAAKRGSARAKFQLGIYYRFEKTDVTSAFPYIKEAAEQGFPSAQCLFGDYYDLGLLGAKDIALAAEWYRKGAMQDDPQSQFNLGLYYSKGLVAEKDAKLVAEWFGKAAVQGHREAQCNLGICYENGTGVIPDATLAAKWYRKAADNGFATAQSRLSYFYERGLGVKQDAKLAATWEARAADQGDPQAQNNLGTYYREGFGVPRNEILAIEWYRKSAEQGYASAQFNLGFSFENGFGGVRDLNSAIQWYTKAAAQGHPQAQCSLACCYFQGLGVAKVPVKAFELFQEAAIHGNAKAQYGLGCCYMKGLGVAPDWGKAIEWYGKAAAHGNEDAKVNLKFCNAFERARTIRLDESYKLIFSEWNVKKKPEVCRDREFITLTGGGLKLLQDHLEKLKDEFKLTKELIESLYNQSEEKKKLEEEFEKARQTHAREELYQEFHGFQDKLLEDYGKLGELQKNVHALLANVKNILIINRKLVSGNHYQSSVVEKRKARLQEKLASLTRRVEGGKFDCQFDQAFQDFREKYEVFKKLHDEKSNQIKQLFEVQDLKGMELVFNEIKVAFDELNSLIRAMRAQHDELVGIKKELKDQQTNFFVEVEKTRDEELAALRKDKQKYKEHKEWEKKQTEALQRFEKQFQKMQEKRAKERETLRQYAEDRKRWKEEQEKKKEAARRFEAEKKLERDREREKDKLTVPEGDGKDGNPTGKDPEASADVKLFRDDHHRRSPKELTLDAAGTFSARISESERKQKIDSQMQEGRKLITQIMEENNIELKTFALLGKFGQILESMSKSKTLDGKATPLAIVAESIRNTVFHGEVDIIPNFEGKLSSEAKAIEFLEQLKDSALELLTTDWQQGSHFGIVKLPILSVKLAFYRLKDKDIDDSKSLTAQELHILLEKHKETLKVKINHSKESCIFQLMVYSEKLKEMKKLQTSQHTSQPEVLDHAIGYLMARVSTYMMNLRALDEASFREGLAKIESIDIKLGAMYRHNELALPPVILSAGLRTPHLEEDPKMDMDTVVRCQRNAL